MTAEYFVGRANTALDGTTGPYVDALFAADRREGDKFSALHFSHSTFANNSLKGSELAGCVFVNVAFVGVYFRDTVLRDCRFEGCKFINCDMERVDIRSCTLKYYNTFDNTYVPFDRMSESLPKEGNLRQMLCENLSRQASAAGAFRDAGRFRAAAMEGQIDFLKAVATRRSPHYAEKYSLQDQVEAAVNLAKVTLGNAIWGATRSHWIVLRNWAITAVLAFAVFALFCHDSVGADSTWWRAGLFGSVATVPIEPPNAYALSGELANILTVGFRFLGLMFAALFTALVFARVYEGRR